jgi:hypothetical protein
MALRFAIEILKSVAIITALPLGIGFAVEVVVFALSDQDLVARLVPVWLELLLAYLA